MLRPPFDPLGFRADVAASGGVRRPSRFSSLRAPGGGSRTGAASVPIAAVLMRMVSPGGVQSVEISTFLCYDSIRPCVRVVRTGREHRRMERQYREPTSAAEQTRTRGNGRPVRVGRPPQRPRSGNAWPDPPTDSAVRSILRILVSKRHLERTPEGHRYVYSPTKSVVRARRSAMHRVLRTFFGGSVEGAVAMLLELDEGDLTPGERERIKTMIDEAEEDGR